MAAWWPRVTSAGEDKFITVTSPRNHQFTTAQIKAHISSCCKATTTQGTARVKKHKQWTGNQWKSVHWTDESKSKISGFTLFILHVGYQTHVTKTCNGGRIYSLTINLFVQNDISTIKLHTGAVIITSKNIQIEHK